MATLKGELNETFLSFLNALRHDVHSFPELGFEEVETQNKLIDIFKKHSFESVKVCAKTGLVVDLQGKGPESASLTSSFSSSSSEPFTVALRADIDCLPMDEENNLPYKSKSPGKAHMCGHDGHLTILVGAALLLKKMEDKLPRNSRVRFLFQPAEEGPGGAPVMIREGALLQVQEVYGQHNFPVIPLGEVRVAAGPVMAHVTTLFIDIHGRGGHGSQPQVAVDPIVIGAHVITALQSIVSRNIHPKEQAVVSICKVVSGTTHNVIPDTCHLTGTIRDFDPEVFATIKARIEAIVENTCKAHGGRGEVRFQEMYPVLVNTPQETEHLIRVAKKELGEGKVSGKDLPILGAEDFSFYTQKVPGCFFFLGGQEEGKLSAMCHSTKFDFNDNSTPFGVALWVRLIEDRFGVSLYQ